MTANNRGKTVPLPAPLRPAQGKAPAAQTTSLPPETLADLAEKVGVPQDKLALLKVRECAQELNSAVKLYVSFSPVPHGHPQVPLAVDACARTKDDDAGGSDDEFGHGSLFAMPGRRRHRSRTMGGTSSGVGGRGAPLAPRPVLSVDLSLVAFVWPPPPHLTAERLVAVRDANPNISLQKAVLDVLRDGPVAADDKDDEEAKREIIYLFFYDSGRVQDMLLVSATGMHALLNFAEEALEWHTLLTSAPDLLARFKLLRFKLQRWESEGLRRARPAESVVLAGDQMETILADVERFLSEDTRNWYFRHGLPYRRAFLFYGPPGTGKTSTVRVIASKFRLNVCVLTVSNNSFSNESLGDALSGLPPNAVLVLEDVDALFNEDRSNKFESQLTFSGLLNALDGLASVEGLLTIMTTNHIDRLETALIRGGRVDRRFRFDLPSDEQLCKLFRSFYPECAAEVPNEFVKAVRGRKEGDQARAISTLQQLFIETREKSAEECVSGLDEFFKQHFPPEDRSSRLMYLI